MADWAERNFPRSWPVVFEDVKPPSRRMITTGRSTPGEATGRSRRPATSGRRRLRAATVLATAGLLAAFATSSTAEAKTIWKIKGAGWGHGVGMSQYGAYGLARKGRTYGQIIRHYYRGTTIGTAPAGKVRVLLRSNLSAVGFKRATRACGRRLSRSGVYRATRRGSRIILRNRRGKRLANCGRVMRARGRGTVRLLGKGTYRGALEARLGYAGLDAVNLVGIDGYVRGVIAREMPDSWHMQALRAQAVAARSYALANAVGGGGFDLYDDTRSQVYGGIAAETARSSKAVTDTARQVALYEGEVATTFFFSTSGGYTENNENVWRGEAIPYLRGVPDPYDDLSPYHRWKVKRSMRAMRRALNDVTPGRFKSIKVLRRGASPRIVSARLIGTRGKRKVRGTRLQVELGLRDTWAYFRRIRKGSAAASVAAWQRWRWPPLGVARPRL